MVRLCITGGAGFIGSAMVNRVSKDEKVVVIDKYTYCSRKANWLYPHNVIFYQVDINNSLQVMRIFEQNDIKQVIHFAAQTHVDNSFGNVGEFMHDNVMGTYNLLEVARTYGRLEKFVHVSTDEVYGENENESIFHEETYCKPTNPYAATKASAEFMAWSYHKSYGLPIVITRGNNVYGPGQYPEKLIPKFILQTLFDIPHTIHGAGQSLRTFVYVEDAVDAFNAVLERGEVGHRYNIGSLDEHSVVDISQMISQKIKPTNMVTVADRNFNDRRYHIDSSKIRSLGWEPKTPFDEGFNTTIDWYSQRREEYRHIFQ